MAACMVCLSCEWLLAWGVSVIGATCMVCLICGCYMHGVFASCE